jgi:hypothetical protein
MTNEYSTLFENCILWWEGKTTNITGFPIIPTGVTVTPAGTFANDLNLGTNVTLKTFDGSTNYIRYTNVSPLYFGSNNFTVTFWIKANSIIAANNIIFSSQESIGDYSPLLINWGSGFEAMGSSGASWDLDLTSTVTPVVDTWYYVTITRSGNTFTMRINGISNSSVTYSNSLMTTNNYFYIGSNLPVNRYLSGNLKDFMIFTRALSQSEIITVMRKTNPASGQDNFYPTLSGIRGVE